MGAKTGIQWCDHTFNLWWGCTKVSPGCANCYAETLAGRFEDGLWGRAGRRRLFGEAHWREPLAWARRARRAGVRARVFCGSMCDVFEELSDGHPQAGGLDAARLRLWGLVESTEDSLDWLLLTKRPEGFASMLPAGWLDVPAPNVWLGVSVEDQRRAEGRIPVLLATSAAVRFVSYEPALEAVEWGPRHGFMRRNPASQFRSGLDWLIVGGESGAKARPFRMDWAWDAIKACRAAGVACFVKQLGAVPWGMDGDSLCDDGTPPIGSIRDLRDRKGGTMDEWPEELRVREFPMAGITSRARGQAPPTGGEGGVG